MKRKEATKETGKRLLAKSNAELLSSVTREGAKSANTVESFIETIPLMYSRFALRVEKAIVPYCCRKIPELLFFLL